MKYYPNMIQLFGAPNGLCSSITEFKHIKAVKQPYCHCNCHNALGQVLLTNQQLDKLARCWVDFQKYRMLSGTCVSHILKMNGSIENNTSDELAKPGQNVVDENESEEDGGPVNIPMSIEQLQKSYIWQHKLVSSPFAGNSLSPIHQRTSLCSSVRF